MRIRDKLYSNRAPVSDYLAWQKKQRRTVAVLAAIIFIPLLFLYGLLLKVILAR